MANNILISEGTDKAVWTDEVTGAKHVQYIKLVDGTEDSVAIIPGDATNGLDVDVTRVVPGTSATHLGKAEDAAHSSGDVGVMMLGVRKDSPPVVTLLCGDGDYSLLGVDAYGALGVSGLYIPSGTRVSKTVDYASGASATAIWTPTSGYRFVITHIVASAATAGLLTIYDNTNSSGNIVAKLNLDATGGWDGNFEKIHFKSSAINNVLKMDSATGATGSVTVHGYEIQ
jgi:hypothetical protein